MITKNYDYYGHWSSVSGSRSDDVCWMQRAAERRVWKDVWLCCWRWWCWWWRRSAGVTPVWNTSAHPGPAIDSVEPAAISSPASCRWCAARADTTNASALVQVHGDGATASAADAGTDCMGRWKMQTGIWNQTTLGWKMTRPGEKVGIRWVFVQSCHLSSRAVWSVISQSCIFHRPRQSLGRQLLIPDPEQRRRL